MKPIIPVVDMSKKMPGQPGYPMSPDEAPKKQPSTKNIPLTQKALSGAYNKAVNSNKAGVGFGGDKPLPSQNRGSSTGYMSQQKKK